MADSERDKKLREQLEGLGSILGLDPEESDKADSYLDRAFSLEEDQFDWAKQAYEEDRDWSRGEYESQQSDLDRLLAQGQAGYTGYGQQANAQQDALMRSLLLAYGDQAKDIAPGAFVGGYDSAAAGAAPGRRSIKAQYSVLDDLGERAKGGLTPIERMQMEMARRTQERDLRGSREAMMRNLEARGASSSGLEVAALLGAQQETAQRRSLEEMGAQAMGQERADRALSQRGALAGDIRGQSFQESYQTGLAGDEASQFNKNLAADYQQYVTNTQMKDRAAKWGMTQDLTGAAAANIQDKYQRNLAPYQWSAQIEGTRSGVNPTTASQPSTSGLADILKARAGAEQAKEAAKQVRREDDEFNPINPLTWI